MGRQEGGRDCGDGGLKPDFWGAPTCQCWGGGGTPATEVPKAGALAGAMGAGSPSCLLPLPLCRWWGVCRRDSVCSPAKAPPDPRTQDTHTNTHIQTQAAGRAHPLTSTRSQPSQASHHLISQRQPLHCLLCALFWALHNLHSKLRRTPTPFAQSTTCLWRPGCD